MKRQLSLLIIVGILAACGSSDSADQPAAEPAPSIETEATAGDEPEQPSVDDPEVDEPEVDDPEVDEPEVDEPEVDEPEVDEPGAAVVIDSLDDIPSECRKIMGAFLRELEPILEGIDWENATIGDLEEIELAFDEPGTRLDTAMTNSGCDDLDFGPDPDAELELTLELARQEAPGFVTYLEFVRDLSAAFEEAGVVAGVPTDCDGALAFVAAMADRTDTVSEVPIPEYAALTAAMTTIQTECPPERSNAFYEDSIFDDWISG